MKLKAVHLILLLLCGTALAAEPLDRSQQARLRLESLHPGAVIEQTAGGDLDGDKVSDIAYVVRWQDSDELIIGVLRGQPGGKFKPWSHSKRINGYQQLPEVAIQDKALQISLTRFGLSWGNWATRDYELRGKDLVQVRSSSFYRSPAIDDEPGPVVTESKSSNELTGVVIRTRTTGKDSETTTFRDPPGAKQTLAMLDNAG